MNVIRRPTPRILLADDGPDNILLFTITLEGVAHVKGVENGVAALKYYEQAKANGQPFDLLILDIAMPDLTGFEVAAVIRETGDSETKIAFLTAYGEPATYATASRYNAPVWRKPILPTELVRLVCELVGC